MSLVKLHVPQIFIDNVKPDDEINTVQFVRSELNILYLTKILHNLHKRSGGDKPPEFLKDALIDLVDNWVKSGKMDAAESGNLPPLMIMAQINRMIIRSAPKEIKWIVHSLDQLKYDLLPDEEKEKYLVDKVANMDQDPDLNVFRQKNELGKRWDQMMPDDYHELDNFKPEIPSDPLEVEFQRNQGQMISPERRSGWGNMGNWRHRFDAIDGRQGAVERENIHYRKDMSAYKRDGEPKVPQTPPY